MKKILILGGFGFLGKNLNKVFLNSNYQIYNESRRTKCDLKNIEHLREKLIEIKPDIIINSAANVGSIAYVSNFAADVVYENTLMYVNLYKAIQEINPKILIINPISNCSYPGIIDIQSENEWWNGKIHDSVISYGTPKKMGFIISNCYEKQYGIKTVNLILPNAYGPGDHLDEQRTHAMNGIILRMMKSKNKQEKTFQVWGTGNPIREWVYMPDVARLIKIIIDNEKFNLPNPLNIGQEYGISINASVALIKNKLNYDVSIQHDLSKQDGAPIKILSKKLFNEHFPEFEFTDYEEGINNTIIYYGSFI